MLAISLRQRNDGQLRFLNKSVLGVRKGTRRMERATAAWTRSMAMAFRSRRLPCQTGDAYSPVLDVESISTVVPLLLDVVLSTSTLEALHVQLL